MMTKLICIFMPCLLLVSGCRESAPDRAQVVHDTLTQLNEAGFITAANTIGVSSPNWGGNQRITWMISEGVHVDTGDTVVAFDPSDLTEYIQRSVDQLATLRLNVTSRRTQGVANQTRSKNAIDKALLAKERADLDADNLRFESRSVRENSKLAGRQAEIDLIQARSSSLAQASLDSLELAQALLKTVKQEAQVERRQTYLNQLTMTAPTAGMVVYHREYTEEGIKFYRVGDEVRRQAQVLEITDTSAMKVTFTVHEKDRWRLRKGQPVKVILDAYVDMEFHGMIVNVSRMPLEVADGQVVRRFEVSASISENDFRLKPGMSARVIIELGGQS
jgi:multidrug resistance efflux pump